MGSEDIDKFKKINIIGISMVMSGVLYAGLAWLLDRTGMIHPMTSRALFPAFLAISAGLFVPLLILRGKRNACGAQPEVQSFVSLSMALFPMGEAPAVMGFALFILTGSWQDFASLLLLSGFYFSFAWPTRGGT